MAVAARKTVAPVEDAPHAAQLDPQLVLLMSQAETLVTSMQSFFTRLDKSLYSEFRVIAGFISKARDEIAALRPNDISRERIPTAGAELEAIVRDTETATHQIMNAAESLLASEAADLESYKAEVEARVMEIFEACGFQDITGQRVTKVVNVLKQIEGRISRLATELGVQDDHEIDEAPKKDPLLNGPAVDGPETNQDDIDAMFADGAEIDQNDIDALFD